MYNKTAVKYCKIYIKNTKILIPVFFFWIFTEIILYAMFVCLFVFSLGFQLVHLYYTLITNAKPVVAILYCTFTWVST